MNALDTNRNINGIVKSSKKEKIQTPKEAFSQISVGDFELLYQRVPITPDSSPDPVTFDTLFSLLKNEDQDVTLFFSSQTGRGRSVTAQIVAHLIMCSRTYQTISNPYFLGFF